MKIQGIDHIELHVGNLDDAIADWQRFDFTAEIRSDDSALLRYGANRLLLTAGPAASEYVRRHGDGVAMIAFRTDDVHAAFADAIAGGAEAIAAPAVSADGDGRTRTAIVSGFGDVTHLLIECGDDDTEASDQPEASDLFTALDHVAICLPPGQLDAAVRLYQNAFGLTQVFDERIEVNGQAMVSKVVQNLARTVTFTLIQPDPDLAPGQIDQFLAAHGGAGVQHLALLTTDIARAIRILADRGVEFLSTSDGYYRALAARLGPLALDIGTLRELHVLADRDRWGHLFQIFTRSAHDRGTFFIELIERQGALTFGGGNIRALYAALDDEQSATTLPATTLPR
jgi:4-hydroxymandelate synthase